MFISCRYPIYLLRWYVVLSRGHSSLITNGIKAEEALYAADIDITSSVNKARCSVHPLNIWGQTNANMQDVFAPYDIAQLVAETGLVIGMQCDVQLTG